MNWRDLDCRICREPYFHCECFRADGTEQKLAAEQKLAEACARAQAKLLQDKRRAALELAIAKVRA